ncbi:Casein kinase substrate phosphoprotein PP28 domain containing protein [Naviculisporaceae sp. PSN 640]
MSGRGAPGANSRGRGGKFKKFTRGGGKHFSRDLRPLDADGNEISMWSADAQNKDIEESDEEGSSEEEESEESEDEAGPSKTAVSEAQNREERKNQKKARKEAAIAKAKQQAVQVGDLPPSDSEEESEDDMPANPNRSAAARNQTKASVKSVTEGVEKLNVGAPASRREREAADAAAAKERYRKLHEAGKTDEAKADLARLKLIREKREAEAARKQAEKEEREAIEAEKKAQIEAREAKRREAALGPKKGKTKK